jgi:hypothetical protein
MFPNTIQDILSNKKSVKVKPNIDCTKCKSFSGWTNDDLLNIKTDAALKCQSCGEVCINVMTKKADTTVVAQDKVPKTARKFTSAV